MDPATQQRCYFLELPTELRLMIYPHLFEQSLIRPERYESKEPHEYGWRYIRQYGWRIVQQASILSVSRQIMVEALPIFIEAAGRRFDELEYARGEFDRRLVGPGQYKEFSLYQLTKEYQNSLSWIEWYLRGWERIGQWVGGMEIGDFASGRRGWMALPAWAIEWQLRLKLYALQRI